MGGDTHYSIGPRFLIVCWYGFSLPISFFRIDLGAPALLRFAYIGEKVIFTQEVVVTIGRRVEFGEFGRITICANNEYSYDLNTNVN